MTKETCGWLTRMGTPWAERLLCCLLLAPAMNLPASADDLETVFQNPPMSTRPQVWWHWMNGHLGREAITRELESMKNTGIGGFTLFNTAEGTPPGPVRYMSEEWFRLLAHTVAEARRLGLLMAMHNGAGWSSSGGPWVTPDRAMQEVVWKEKQLQGPLDFEGLLEIPEPALGIERDMTRDPEVNQRYYVPREKVRGHYRDIVLLAFPTLAGDLAGKPFRVDNWRPKAGFSKLTGGYKADSRQAPAGETINPDTLLDLSAKLDQNGRLVWKVPPGNWTLLRIGYQPTGRQNHPAPPDGRGLEIDKMSSAAVDFYWQHGIAKFLQVSAKTSGNTFKALLVDSYEVGHQNWNATFAGRFKSARGYDLTRYLPALTGRVVGDMETTERFLWDYRKTISDLIVDNYYGRVAELCRRHGLTFLCEAYGTFGNTDDFAAIGVPHVPMCEWWAFRNEPGHAVTARLAASAAHTYGRPIVGAEAFTGAPDRIFEEHPFSMKAQGDYFFCQGVNRFSFHTFVHDPYGRLPGLGLGTYGTRIDPRNTWWPFARPWFEYLARCQALLQQGRPVADLLYFAGEDAPQACKVREELKPLPPAGFDYDFANRQVLDSAKVRDGRLVLPSGMSYRVLVLPETRHMRLEVLKQLETLVKAGAIIVGPKPLRTPGLEGGGKADTSLRRLADRVWGACDGVSTLSQNYHKGRVYWGQPLETILSELEVSPDCTFTFTGNQRFETKPLYPGNGVEFIHRRVSGADLYFVSNQHYERKTVEAVFRVGNKQPELWYPDTGTIESACRFRAIGSRAIAVRLSLDPAGSVFVVFRQALGAGRGIVAVESDGQPAEVDVRGDGDRLLVRSRRSEQLAIRFEDGSSRTVKISQMAQPLPITGPWRVSFPPGWGAPDHITMNQLISLAQHDNAGVRHFSGVATYNIKFQVPAARLTRGQRPVLELGDVQVIADVTLNGRSLGVLWKAPFSMPVGDALQVGENELEIRVANLWVNRLIGDRNYADDCQWTTRTGSTAKGKGLAEMPAWVIHNTARPSPDRKAFVSWQWPHLEKKQLLPSGLIGPVTLVSYGEAEVK